MWRARDSSHRRQLASLLAAMALHGLLLLVVSKRPPAPLPVAPPLTVELVEVEPKKSVVTPPAPAPVIEKRATKRESTTGGATKRSAKTAPGAPAQEVATTPSAGGEIAPQGGGGSGVVVPDGVDLFSTEALGEVVSRSTRGRGEVTNGEHVDEGTRVGGRLGEELREGVAFGRAQGPQPSWVGDIANGVRDSWKPDPSQVGLSEGGTSGERLSNLWSGSAPVAGQYGRTGSPYLDGRKPSGYEPARPVERDLYTGGFDTHDFMQRWNDGELAFGEVTVVARVLHWNGVGFSVRLLEPSGRPAFDDAALEAIRKAAQAQREIPDGTESTWRLSARFVPQTCGSMGGVLGGVAFGRPCGGVFDPSLGTFEKITAGKMNVLTTVELVALLEPGIVPEVEILGR